MTIKNEKFDLEVLTGKAWSKGDYEKGLNFNFNFTDEEREYLVERLAQFVRGYWFMRAEKPATEIVKKIEGRDIEAGTQIDLNMTITISIELIIGFLGERLPGMQPHKFPKIEDLPPRKQTLKGLIFRKQNHD